MKFNKYYIGALAAVAIILIIFSQRSDWDSNRYILSADNTGNLNPISESYFQNEENRIKSQVDAALAGQKKKVDFLIGLFGKRGVPGILRHGALFGPNDPGVSCQGVKRGNKCQAHGTFGCSRAINCPPGLVAIRVEPRDGGQCMCGSLAEPWTMGVGL